MEQGLSGMSERLIVVVNNILVCRYAYILFYVYIYSMYFTLERIKWLLMHGWTVGWLP